MSRTEALKVAEEAGVDLVEISPNANPPVAKVVDWQVPVPKDERTAKEPPLQQSERTQADAIWTKDWRERFGNQTPKDP